jgi:hypothetical protein
MLLLIAAASPATNNESQTMPGQHEVHAIGRVLRKNFKAHFPETQFTVRTSGRYGRFAPAYIWVSWFGNPPRGSVETFLENYKSDYQLTINHLFKCPVCGEDHPTGPDDLPTGCINW